MEKSWPIIIILAVFMSIMIPHNIKVDVTQSGADRKIDNVIQQSNQVFAAILKKLEEHDKALGIDNKAKGKK